MLVLALRGNIQEKMLFRPRLMISASYCILFFGDIFYFFCSSLQQHSIMFILYAVIKEFALCISSVTGHFILVFSGFFIVSLVIFEWKKKKTKIVESWKKTVQL